jgi:hypothetical protein
MDYDGDDNDFYRERMPKARKEHVCCECKGVINIGEQYQYASGKADGDMWQAKTCALCCEIRKSLVCGSWVFGALWDEIENHIFPAWKDISPIDCLARIDSLAARNKLREAYAEYLK